MSIFLNTSAMHSHRKIRILAAAFVLFFGAIAFSNHTARAQQQRNNPLPPRPVMPNYDPFDMPRMSHGDPIQNRQNERRLQYMNAERQKSMVAETNRLVKLAADLNAQINSGERTQLTPDQARQFAEIEKLARRIRDRMSTSVRQPPSFDSNPGYYPTR